MPHGNFKHGHTGSRTYATWIHLKEKRPMVPRWRESFNNFLEDVGERPCRPCVFKRADNTKPYGPGNGAWT